MIYDNKIPENIIIMRTETLNNDMHNICYNDFDINENVTYKNKMEYVDLLNEDAKEIVHNYYHMDFEMFCYSK